MHHVCHEPFEAAWVLQFPAERVRRIVWALRHDQDRVASARHQLFDELVLPQNPFYIVSPAMKVNDEVNLARLVDSSSRFGYFVAKVGCCATRDGWQGDVGGQAGEGLGTCRRVRKLAGGGWLEG
jgi:hypothetical protein